MNARYFQCASCGYKFEVPHGTGTMGSQMSCPKCGGIVHRIDRGNSWKNGANTWGRGKGF